MTSVGADRELVTTADDSMALLRAWLGGRHVSLDDVALMQATRRRIFRPFRYGFGVVQFRIPRLLSRSSSHPDFSPKWLEWTSLHALT